jgi:hypothetical protein
VDIETKTNSKNSSSKKESAIVEFWTKEIESSDQNEKPWRDEAEKYFQIYKDEYNTKSGIESKRYNVFWSNTQTLRPLIFSKLPKANITQRFTDENKVAKIASEMMERVVNLYLSDSEAEDVIGKCRDDFLIGGRGVARVVYDPEEVIEIEDGGEIIQEIDNSEKKCRLEYVDWNNFRISQEKEWSKVRWIAFRHFKTRDELVEDFGKKGSAVDLNKKRLDYSSSSITSDDDNFKVAEIWEVWDRESEKVLFLTIGGNGLLLDEQENPYNLKGFFPIPAPLGSKSDPTSLTPIPLYRLYKSQAEELNKIDARIKSLIEQCKATGVYSSTAEQSDIENLFNGDDGSFSPLRSTTGIQKVSDLVLFKPLNEIILTIRELQQHKIEIINAIRDITGISDIVRGVSTASETATAQQLKGNFAISRIQPIQKEIEFWSRDLIRLLIELAVENYTTQELAEMTSLKVIDIETIAAQTRDRQKVLMMEAQKQIDPNDPQINEKIDMLKQQAEKGFKETLKQPLELLKGYAITPQQLQELDFLIKSDKMRTFLVDVETDSTIRIDQQQEKQSRIEYITAISNFSSAFFPLLQSQIITPEAFQQFLMFISKPFKVGRNVEESLQRKEEKEEQKQPSAEEMLAQAELQLKQQELQLKQQELQIKADQAQQELDIKKAQVKFDIEKHQDNLEFEDVNRQADREASRLDMIVKARTEILNDQIRNSNQPAQV